MSLHSLPAVTTPFAALRTSYPVNIIPNIEAPKAHNKMPRNPPFCFLIHVLLF